MLAIITGNKALTILLGNLYPIPPIPVPDFPIPIAAPRFENTIAHKTPIIAGANSKPENLVIINF